MAYSTPQHICICCPSTRLLRKDEERSDESFWSNLGVVLQQHCKSIKFTLHCKLPHSCSHPDHAPKYCVWTRSYAPRIQCISSVITYPVPQSATSSRIFSATSAICIHITVSVAGIQHYFLNFMRMCTMLPTDQLLQRM